MATPSTLDSALRRDRWFILAGLAVLSLLFWLYMLYHAAGPGSFTPAQVASPVVFPHSYGVGVVDLLLMFVMWMVMMLAMMIPTSTNMVLAFAALHRKQDPREGPLVPTGLFVLGYLVVRGGFSLLLTLIQAGFLQAAMPSRSLGQIVPQLGEYCFCWRGASSSRNSNTPVCGSVAVRWDSC